jgi:uncharacterized phage-associated protein
MPYDAREIANYFLDQADEKGMELTIMSLLKLVYFAHGWNLAKFGQPLVENTFEAWEHGPVVRVLYECFHKAGSNPIKTRATKFDPITATRTLSNYALQPAETQFLRQIFSAYAHLHAFQLSHLSHERGSPWDDLWNQFDGSTNPGMKISNEKIRAHFLRRHNFETKH